MTRQTSAAYAVRGATAMAEEIAVQADIDDQVVIVSEDNEPIRCGLVIGVVDAGHGRLYQVRWCDNGCEALLRLGSDTVVIPAR